MKRNVLVSTAAKRYAHAFLEVSIKQRNFSVALDELGIFQKQLENVPLLNKLFLTPAISPQTKTKVLMDLGEKQKFQKLTMNFLKTMVHRGRLPLLEQVIVSSEQQFLERQGILVVEVFTAKKMPPEEEKRLVRKLESVTGKEIQLENRVEPSLIGGAVTRIGTTLFDGSVQAQLEQLRARIQEE